MSRRGLLYSCCGLVWLAALISVASAQTPILPAHPAASRQAGASPKTQDKAKSKPRPAGSTTGNPAAGAEKTSPSSTKILQAVCQLREGRCIAMDDAHLGAVTSLPIPAAPVCHLSPGMMVSAPEANALVTELGSIAPFTAKSDSKSDQVRLYSSSAKIQEQQTTQVEKRLGVLFADAERSYSVDFAVPHRRLPGKPRGAGQVANPELASRKATSMEDFGGISLREFHRGMLYCLASEDSASSPAPAELASAPSGTPCSQISPADAFPDPE